MGKKIRVRSAREDDAEGILRAQHSAVHVTAARDYPAGVVAEWSAPVTRERVRRYLSRSFPEETTVVAEHDGEIAGFGSIVAAENELRAVYVSAKYGRLGIGTERAGKKMACVMMVKEL